MEHAVPRRRWYSVKEYIELETTSVDKHEYRYGEIVSMAGGTLAHSGITTNILGELRHRLNGSPCRAFDSNLRIQFDKNGLYCYPDATVICGTPVLSDVEGVGPTYTNPRLVVEVLSPSTRAGDESEKFDKLRELSSFEEYVLIEQHTARVETRYRQPNGHWVLDFALGLHSEILLRSLAISIPLSEIYAGITFPPRPEAVRPAATPAT
jgi:Uma2 family endonuclease